MEPNPIFWLELRQLRRSPFTWFFFLVALAMCGFLFLDGFDNAHWGHFQYGFPMLFHLFALFGVPYTRASLFVSQQISESDLFQTPMSRADIFFAKLKTGLVLTLCTYVPVLPGVAYLVAQNRPGYPIAFWLSFVGTLCLLSTFLGFMAGVKTAAGVVRRIVALLAFFMFGWILFWIGYWAILTVANDLFGFDAFSNETIVLTIFAATVYLLGIAGLTAWLGIVLFDPKRKPGPLIGFLWISGIALLWILMCVFSVNAGDFGGMVLTGLIFVLSGFFGIPLLLLMGKRTPP